MGNPVGQTAPTPVQTAKPTQQAAPAPAAKAPTPVVVDQFNKAPAAPTQAQPACEPPKPPVAPACKQPATQTQAQTLPPPAPAAKPTQQVEQKKA